MIIPCPLCQMMLKLPEDVEGKKVRCPGCKEVFRANQETLAGACSGKNTHAAALATGRRVCPNRADVLDCRIDDHDKDQEVRRPRRLDDDEADEPEEENPLQQMREQEDAIVARAKRKARVAGALMLLTGFFILSNVGVNAVLSQMANAEIGPPPGVGNDAAFRAG